MQASQPQRATCASIARALGVCVTLVIVFAGCQRTPAGEEALPPPAASTAARVPLPPQSKSPATPVPMATLAKVALVESAPAQSEACRAHGVARGAAVSVAVHRWTDAAGITHYSDQAPPRTARDARIIEVHGLPPIDVRASGYDMDLPDQLQQRAIADALGVQRALRDSLGVPAEPGSTLRIVFVRDAKTYARLIGDPVLATSAGAYSPAQRTIYVRMQARDEDSFAVLRHEITHALVHASIGNLPTPINEGLAEYFGRYRIGGLGGQIDIVADRAALMRAAPAGDGSEALVDLLARDGADFYATSTAADAREQRYLRAYALVALLMRELPRGDLAALLAAQRATPCQPVAVEKLLDAHTPGGLRDLAQRWAGFMRDPPADIQAY